MATIVVKKYAKIGANGKDMYCVMIPEMALIVDHPGNMKTLVGDIQEAIRVYTSSGLTPDVSYE